MNVPTANGRLTKKDRAMIKGELTRLHRLLAGTLVPALDRSPDQSEHWKASIAEAERLAESLETIVINDENRARLEGPIDDGL
jgi:hypothetical protein